MSPRCDLDLEDKKKIRTTLWLMTLHHHTKFGNKMFCDSEDIIRTNIHWQWTNVFAWHSSLWRFITILGLVKNVLWFRRCRPDKHSRTFWTFTVTFTLNAVIQFFHRTLRLMMLCYQTKFGCKRTSSLEATVKRVIFDYISPRCDLAIKYSEPVLLHGTLAYDAG